MPPCDRLGGRTCAFGLRARCRAFGFSAVRLYSSLAGRALKDHVAGLGGPQRVYTRQLPTLLPQAVKHAAHERAAAVALLKH